MNRKTCMWLAVAYSVVAVISQNLNSIGSGLVALALWAGYFFAYDPKLRGSEREG